MKGKLSAHLFLLTFLFYVSSSLSQTLANQKEALKVISDFANELCNQVGTGGSSQSTELSVDAKAKLNGVVSKVADLGIEGAGKWNSNQYQGLLRQDLAKAVSDASNCKLAVFKDLKDKLLPPAPTAARGSTSGGGSPIGGHTSKSADSLIDGRFGKTESEVRASGVQFELNDTDQGLEMIYEQDIFGLNAKVAQRLTGAEKRTGLARAWIEYSGKEKRDTQVVSGLGFEQTRAKCSVNRFYELVDAMKGKYGAPVGPTPLTTFTNDNGDVSWQQTGAGWKFDNETKLIARSFFKIVYKQEYRYWNCKLEFCAIPAGSVDSCFTVPKLTLH
ncbi:hypothetical protein [Paraburkholderia caledonica]|uniref:hypothetical protein n=1 Tax=Paraburkholderia caledonica TaxID=134536 RepID=UPI000B404B9D|nr:hypothetical protein [Paraburkholderia caledonica]